MKNKAYPLIFSIFILLCSCTQSSKNAAQRSDEAYKLIKSREQCFTAIFQKDSAFLKFKTLPSGKIVGRLVIKYGDHQPDALDGENYHGEITGQFKKDTLFAAYTFADGAFPTVYKKPIALLRRENKLILGFGVIENYLGETWFVDHSKINFDRARFQFLPAECKN